MLGGLLMVVTWTGIDEFLVLRNLHNSLSRSSERADLDIALICHKVERQGRGSGENDEAFHFISYVPVNGVVWEVDGLRRQPVRLGSYRHLLRKTHE